MEMKKYLFLSAFAYSSLVMSTPEYLRYVGVDAGLTYTKNLVDTFSYPNRDTVKVRHDSMMGGVYTGYRMGRFAAFEFGTFGSRSLNGSRVHREGGTHVDGLHMGFVFFLPVVGNFEALPGLGVAHIAVHSSKPKFFDNKDKGIVPRLMFGAQYRLTERLRLRGTVSWHRMSGIYSQYISNNQSFHFGIGLNYSFMDASQ